jgi:hypothetical protein
LQEGSDEDDDGGGDQRKGNRNKRGNGKKSSAIAEGRQRRDSDESSLTDDSDLRGESFDHNCLTSESQLSLKEAIRKHREDIGMGSPETEARKEEIRKQNRKLRRAKRRLEKKEREKGAPNEGSVGGDSVVMPSPTVDSASFPSEELVVESTRIEPKTGVGSEAIVVSTLSPRRVRWALGEDSVMETVVTSYTHLVEAVFDFRDSVLSLAPPDADDVKFAFRGLSNKWFGLSNSLSRLEKAVAASAARAIESRVIADFCRSTSKLTQVEDMPPVCMDNVWALLPFMHQHGCVTRLTEWSTNVNAAAYFAVEDDTYADQDGALWCVATNLLQASNASGLTKKLASQAIDLPTYDELQRAIGQMRPSNNRPDHVIDRILYQLKALDDIGEDRFTIAFFEPPLFTPSMVNQSSCYCAVSDPMVKLNHTSDVNRAFMRRIIVPKAIKNEVLQSLELAGVSAKSLVPGITSVSKALTKKYQLRGPPVVSNPPAHAPVVTLPEPLIRRHSKIIPESVAAPTPIVAAPIEAPTELVKTVQPVLEPMTTTATTTSAAAITTNIPEHTNTTGTNAPISTEGPKGVQAWTSAGRPKTPGDAPKKHSRNKYKNRSKNDSGGNVCLIA